MGWIMSTAVLDANGGECFVQGTGSSDLMIDKMWEPFDLSVF